jgi:rubrerythrin
MVIHTASEGVTLARKLENESAKFYETAAQRFGQHADSFLSFAKENKKNVVQIERAYYGVITDAIEGCFAFNIEPDNYILNTTINQGVSHNDVVKRAIKLEESIIKFYAEAVEQSGALMADVPRAFSMIAKKREGRLSKLRSL